MPSDVKNAVDGLRGLGSVSEMRERAARGWGAPRQLVNAHLHVPPNFSAFQSVDHAVELATEQHIGVLGVSNYYDYDVYRDFAALTARNAIFPLYGLEIICLVDDLQRSGVKINDPGNPGKFYFCGKGITRFDPMTPEAARILETIRCNDSSRMAEVVSRLAGVFEIHDLPTGLDEAAVIDRVATQYGCPRNRVYLQERHVCQAFQECLFQMVPPEQRRQVLTRVFGTEPKAGTEDAVGTQNEIRSHLLKAGKPAYVAETFIGFNEAYRLVVELGGIPCYPTLADGASPICPFETPVKELIERIKERGIGCAEFIPIRNKPDVLSAYVKAMRASGLIVTGGTEHNTLDLLPIEPRCVGGLPVPDDVQEIFWEGACVVAAHQFLSLHGERGFEAGCGPDRIESLRRLGAAVIRQYQENARNA